MLTVVLLVIVFAAFWKWNQRRRDPNEPPEFPGAWPFLGHAPMLLGDSCKLWNTVNELAEQSYDLGGVVSYRAGPRIVYIVTDPDDVYTIANTCLEKDAFYRFVKPWLGESLITARVPKWKYYRKFLNPAFNQNVLDSFMGVFNSQSRKLVKDFEKEVGKGLFDHWTYTKLNALETICLTALGVDFTDSTLNMQYMEASDQMFNSMVERFVKFWWHSSRLFKYSRIKKKQEECVKILHNMSNTVLQRRKADYKSKTNTDRTIIPGTKYKPFMDLLLELSIDKGVLSDQEIREYVDTMIVGGHDISANVLMFTMLLLGANPDVQDKAFTEIKAVFGDEDKDVEKQDLFNLVYLEAIIKESLRLFSIAPVIARRLDRDLKLKNYTLPSGRTCFLFLFGIHRHPIWGADRHQFNPERWLDATKLPDNPNAFAAFSVGRRMCVGKAFAYMSLKTYLVHLIRHYRIIADDSKLKLKIDVVLKADSGYFVSIERRT